jgi:DNA-binding winged helix-turn-helix (wHTH) protein
MRLSLGSITLDTDRRQVFRDSEPLHLSAKAFQLLELLVENRPRALSKNELQEALWPDTFVSDTSLTTLVNELRAGLGESAREPRLIRTVHGYGYAFEAPGAAVSGARLVWGAVEVPLYEGENVLGRDPGPRGAIPDASVSRKHARLTLAGDAATLEDLGSKNGTFACDRRVDKPTPLIDGDSIRLGLVTLVFRAASAGASTKTAVPE